MNIDGIDVFVAVVEAQSFTQAAKRLGMPTATVSSKIVRLEADLGVTLLRRTTRRLDVTEQGRTYYRSCVRVLRELEEAENQLKDAKSEPSGKLRISVATDLATGFLPAILEKLVTNHPKVSVELIVTNDVLDMLATGIDVAIRMGPMEDSGIIARKIIPVKIGFWASPEYLHRHSIPIDMADLKKHQHIHFSRTPRDFTLKHNGQELSLNFESKFTTDDVESLKVLMLRGNGIAILPDFLANSLAAMGQLVRVVPEFANEIGSIYACYPSQKFITPALRAFIELTVAEGQF